jgi:hypothetical protein
MDHMLNVVHLLQFAQFSGQVLKDGSHQFHGLDSVGLHSVQECWAQGRIQHSSELRSVRNLGTGLSCLRNHSGRVLKLNTHELLVCRQFFV